MAAWGNGHPRQPGITAALFTSQGPKTKCKNNLSEKAVLRTDRTDNNLRYHAHCTTLSISRRAFWSARTPRFYFVHMFEHKNKN